MKSVNLDKWNIYSVALQDLTFFTFSFLKTNFNFNDIEKAHKYGVERLLNELLPVIDNLEHALNNFSKDSRKLKFSSIDPNISYIKVILYKLFYY